MDLHTQSLLKLVNYDYFASRCNDTVVTKWKKDLADMDLGDQKGIFKQSDLVTKKELVKLHRSAVLRAKETIRTQKTNTRKIQLTNKK